MATPACRISEYVSEYVTGTTPRAYIHLMATAACRISEYVTGTTPRARHHSPGHSPGNQAAMIRPVLGHSGTHVSLRPLP
jgi:hypothetical protein